MKAKLIFHQLYEPETSTYTYLLADSQSREAVLIDPVLETVDRDLKLLNELDLRLKYVLDTHIHADHVTGAGELKKRTDAKSAVSSKAKVACVDIPLEDEQELEFGAFKIKALETPGHTNSCMSFVCEDKVFTGDALLIRGTGRTDFQQGSSEKLYNSITKKLFSLPNDTVVYPGHDYRGVLSSTIELEKKHNPRIPASRTLEDFKKIMSELKLANPKKIHEAVPANLTCGVKSDRVFHPQKVNGIPEITPEDLKQNLNKVKIIDVRNPDEFNNELGHIPGSTLITLGPDLIKYLNNLDRENEIVFTCRSGGRSATATSQSIDLGFKKTANMSGGMLRWNELKFPVERV